MELGVNPANDDDYQHDESPKDNSPQDDTPKDETAKDQAVEDASLEVKVTKRKDPSPKNDVDDLCEPFSQITCACLASSSEIYYTDDTSSTQPTTGQKRKVETPGYDEVRLNLATMRYGLCKMAKEVNDTLNELAEVYRPNDAEYLKKRGHYLLEYDDLREGMIFAENRLHDHDNLNRGRLVQTFQEMAKKETQMLEKYCKYFKDHEETLKSPPKIFKQEVLENMAWDRRPPSTGSDRDSCR